MVSACNPTKSMMQAMTRFVVEGALLSCGAATGAGDGEVDGGVD